MFGGKGDEIGGPEDDGGRGRRCVETEGSEVVLKRPGKTYL
jgi:hypothetical protein